MDGAELKRRLEKLGHATNSERSRALGMNVANVHKMCAGLRPVTPLTAARLENLELKRKLATA